MVFRCLCGKKSDLMWRGTGRDGPDSGDFSEQRLLTVSQSWKSIQLSTKVRINLTFRGSSGVAGRGRSSGLNYPPDRNGFMQSVDSAIIICRPHLHKNHWNSHPTVLVQGQTEFWICKKWMKTSISLEESLEPVDKFLFQISREFIAIYCFALMLMFIAARKQIKNAHNTGHLPKTNAETQFIYFCCCWDFSKLVSLLKKQMLVCDLVWNIIIARRY